MRVGYARVSSVGQSLDVQEALLREAGCEEVFAEKKSGTTTEGREALEQAINFVRSGDTLVVTRLDRLARSGSDLYAIVDRLSAKGVFFQCIQQGAVDTTSSMGKLVLGILGAVAEFETALRKERQRDGIDKAMTANPEKYRGRPAKLDRAAILRLSGEGMKPADIAREVGCNRVTVHKVLRAEREKAEPA
ncbi:recombinase family protein [Sphingomonas crocodyli]|uniref:Recombinase family protein n=1 Tax=Sphingomonas crocodyli TaxID=1979270 RepID=A0A437M171_9SPHN|nr:recombinase family protein [Sphingomonas crocodyli]RVT91293.1 recombinase family protein [Sphingomonas crocodyli]